ncbi:hypothetical protein KW076_00605 [Micrococcus porci]|nr:MULTISPECIES: hypothetical protein [Micrococcus]MCG7422742.1 hypothetical protein [Micrococcus sp. ACRRV]UBH24736.1 hypothetical protein KW076_00605 [Micrococcus porci]
MADLPPELEFAEFDDDPRPSAPSPWVRVLAVVVLLGLVGSLAAGLFGGI